MTLKRCKVKCDDPDCKQRVVETVTVSGREMKLCETHLAFVKHTIPKFDAMIKAGNRKDAIEALKTMCKPSEFNKLMEEIGEDNRSYWN